MSSGRSTNQKPDSIEDAVTPPRIGGIVLCGGQSRRMGRPKAWLPFGPETMLQRVVRVVRRATQSIVVVAAEGQPLPPLDPNVAVVRDELPGRGPLQGLASGLRYLQDAGIGIAYVSSTDAPLLSPAFIGRVASLIGDSLAAVPFVNERYYSMAAAYRTDCLPAIDRLIAAQQLRTSLLFHQVSTRLIAASELVGVDPNLLSLLSVNEPDEYERALRLLADDPFSEVL